MAFKDDEILFQHSQSWTKHLSNKVSPILLWICFLSLCFRLWPCWFTSKNDVLTVLEMLWLQETVLG